MFGLVVAGRLVQTEVQQVDTNRFLFQITQASSAKQVHIVVFLTGAAPFPDGYAATVHFQWHDKPDWRLLGMLSNEKPSAIFKVKGALPPQMPGFGQTPSDTANIGILCEPTDSVQAQVAAAGPATSNPSNAGTMVLAAQQSVSNTQSLGIALRVAKNFLNYLSSFAQSAPSGSSLQTILQDPSGQSALLGLCERWYKSLETKTRNNIDWLGKEQD